MKRIALVILVCMAAVCLQAADIDNISTAFKGGNAAALSQYMDDLVDVALQGGSSKKHSAKEATEQLGAFFQENRPSAFEVIHHADKKDSGFFVGKLSAGGNEYRVNVTYRAEGDKAIIQSIRIE